MGAGGRYLALHVDRTKARPRYAYLLFGAGPRVSIGASFAMIEATLLLAMIAQRFRFTVVPDHPVEPVPTFTLRPRFGIKAPVVPRPGHQMANATTGAALTRSPQGE